jgi:hypothetical protein
MVHALDRRRRTDPFIKWPAEDCSPDLNAFGSSPVPSVGSILPIGPRRDSGAIEGLAPGGRLRAQRNQVASAFQ